jgi:hypothetical protein
MQVIDGRDPRTYRAELFVIALVNSAKLHDWGIMLEQVEKVANSATQSPHLLAVREELDEQIRVSLATFPKRLIAEA